MRQLSLVLCRAERHSPLLKSGRRTATDPSEVQPGPRKSFDSKSWAVLHRTSAPYVLSTSDQLRGRCALRCSSHLGWEYFRQCGGPMYDREVRSGNLRRNARNKRGDNHQTTVLGLVRPTATAHELSRVGFPPPLTLPRCGTYRQGGNGVDAQYESTGRDPAHRRNQRPRVSSGKWRWSHPPGLPSCRTRSASCDVGAHGEPHVEVQRWRS